MRNALILTLPAALLLALGACKGSEPSRSQAEEDPFAGMTGAFAGEKAALIVNNVEVGPMGPRLDIQLTYENKEASGTLFGSADQKDENHFYHEYESSGKTDKVDLYFENGAWRVAHSVAGPKPKNHFDYSGRYAFTGAAPSDE